MSNWLRKKRKAGDITFNAINTTVFLIFTFACIFPFYYIFINTISDNRIAASGRILFLPQGIHFNNYYEILSIKGIGLAALVSVARTLAGTLATLLGSSFLGYVFCKKEYWGRKFWYRFVIVAMYFNAGLIPGFVTIKNLGLMDNFLVYILPATVVPFNVILFKTYVEQLPPSLEESVQIDGGGYFVRFFKIIIPLSAPILATIAVFSCTAQWNAFLDTLLYMNTSKLQTLQFVLYQYLNKVNALAALMRTSQGRRNITDVTRVLTPVSIRMTISFVVVVPILFAYPYLQRYFVKGFMIGSIKG